MAGEACRVRLGDYFTLQRGTTYKSRLLGQPGLVLLGLATIHRNGGFRRDSLQTYGGDSPAKLRVQPGDLYLSLKDVTQSADLLGAVARLPRDHPPGRLTQDTVKLEPRGANVPLDYLYWLLRTPEYRDYCRAHATGTTNLGLSRDDFLAFPAPEPTAFQCRVVDALGTIEDKIELNRRMNGTLEAMAQALFKEWFVDGAKEELEEMMLDDVAYYRNGLALQRFRPKEGEEPLPAVKIAQMRTGLPDSGEWASPNIDPECILHNGDVVFSWSGSLMAILWCGGKAALNQHLFKVTSEKFPKWFYYLWTQEYMPEFQGIASNKATTMGHINRNHLKVPVPIPPPELLKRGDETIAPLLDRIVANNLESRTLTALRDTLLPKLMRGEVRVKHEANAQQLTS